MINNFRFGSSQSKINLTGYRLVVVRFVTIRMIVTEIDRPAWRFV